jgi:hypothetical protein
MNQIIFRMLHISENCAFTRLYLNLFQLQWHGTLFNSRQMCVQNYFKYLYLLHKRHTLTYNDHKVNYF